MPNPRGQNGTRHPPSPDATMCPLIEHYLSCGYSNPEIVNRLKKYYDTDHFQFLLALLKKKCMQWGLKSTRGQAHTLESIGPTVERVCACFPVQGSHDMKKALLQEEKIMVLCYYWMAGINDLWSFDQHVKWRCFQLFLHVGLEPFSGKILWLKIWWANRNPRLICGWYCDTVAKLDGMPLVTQSDPGSENNGIANGHTLLRHLQDPSLEHTLQHKFKGLHRNIKPEIFWNQLRRQWSPGFEHPLNYGLNEGLYNPDDPLQWLTFHYIFIPWLQDKLDLFVNRFNHTLSWHNRNKILPHERPANIFEQPEHFQSQDFAVKVHLPSLAEVRKTYAPPEHHVFELVPAAFAQEASNFLRGAGSPVVMQDNAVLVGQPALPDEGFVGSEFMPLVNLPVYRPTTTPGGSCTNEFSSNDDKIANLVLSISTHFCGEFALEMVKLMSEEQYINGEWAQCTYLSSAYLSEKVKGAWYKVTHRSSNMTESSFPSGLSNSNSKSPTWSVQENEGNNADTLDIVMALLAGISLSPTNAMTLMSAVLDRTAAGGASPPSQRASASTATPPLTQAPVAATSSSSTLVATPTYQGWPFHVPEPGMQGQYYLVTRGHCIGIFAAWQTTSPYVTGVSHATYTCTLSLEAGIASMHLAIDNGEVEILP
ncbi:hypothetical protein SERLA73DRAFT_155093 [Serpula lacrymans var. lacrymans S7.3]|uniref:Integrase core domain-containing protein n=1 Tax=Serpula lacrymans var. lacrymans (strain S7.3) TaxID=936435 RepID=F8Q8C3_SERL3|nr:hypothetical protein SERLA73DRAFT_155093 [Serpula lacrymans var. lacrymans S7.3]